ncbi:MAG: hypothetical protein WC364_14760, partial [Eubacteriales bacterium]
MLILKLPEGTGKKQIDSIIETRREVLAKCKKIISDKIQDFANENELTTKEVEDSTEGLNSLYFYIQPKNSENQIKIRISDHGRQSKQHSLSDKNIVIDSLNRFVDEYKSIDKWLEKAFGYTQKETFEVGDIINHNTYGKGKVKAINGTGRSRVLVVLFDSGETQLAYTYAKPPIVTKLQSSFNRPAPEAGGQKPLTQEVKEKASQKEQVKKVNTYAIGKVNKEILKNEAYVFAKEQGGDPLGMLPLEIRQKYYIAPENWGEVKDAIDGIPYLQQIFKKGETQDRNKNFQIDRWAKEYYIRGNDTQEEIESSWGRVPGYEQYGDIELFTETIKQAYQLKKGSKGSISRVILEKAFESGHPEAIQLEWLIRKKDLFRDGMSKEQVDFAEKEFYNQINEDQENVDRTRERTSKETAEKADFDIEKTEVTGEEAKDFLDGLIENSPARQKDLLGREESEGGAAGKQDSFLDPENYKTLKAKEEINAEADIEGQKSFLQPQQKENNLFAEAAPMVEKAQKMADKSGSNRYVVRTANGKFQIRQQPPKNLVYLIIEPKTGEKPKGFNRRGGFADVSFLFEIEEPPGKKIVIKPRKFRRTLPVADQEIPQNIYDANRKTKRTVAEAKEDIKEFFIERKEGIERVLTSVS